MTIRLTLPKWLLQNEIGLGDAVTRGTAAVGLKPCTPCAQRAERLNQILVATPAADRARADNSRRAILANGNAVMAAVAVQHPLRPGKSEVEHVPRDEGTLESDTDNCCTYTVTLINKRRVRPRWLNCWWLLWLWPWLQAYKVRVTGTTGTTILGADPDEWSQTVALPNSVIWAPGTGGVIAPGDPTDSWIIDNDFLLSLGPVNSNDKTITIEWLGIGGLVLDKFHVRVPCHMGDKADDFETDWEQYTSVVKGGTSTSAYLEPEDCDPGDLDYRSSGSLEMGTPTCAVDSNGDNAYAVTFTLPGPPYYSFYQWTVDGTAQNGQSFAINTLLSPGPHEIHLVTVDNTNTMAAECVLNVDFTRPLPDFVWLVDECTRQVTLTSITENADTVVAWDWICPSPGVGVDLNGDTAQLNFSGVPDGAYEVTLRVTDHYGCQWEQMRTITVGGCEASWNVHYSWCVAKVDPNNKADVTVTFTNTSRACNATWQWNFGDPNADPQHPDTSTEANPTHIYQQASDGQSFPVTLSLSSTQPPCSSTITVPLMLAQRQGPVFTVKACPDGKVVCTTSEPNPVWIGSGLHAKIGWPYSTKDGSRVIYQYFSSGTYTISLTSTDSNGNTCTTRQTITVQLECCTRNAHTKLLSQPITVPLGGHNVQLRVKAKLAQNQAILWHRVKARTKLQRLNSHGRWRSYKSPDVIVQVAFNGTVYRSEWDPLAFDGSLFTGCICNVPEATHGTEMAPNRRKVRAVDGLGGPFQSRTGSIQSQHGVVVAGTSYIMANLSLGPPC